jgi:hypothetical protein
MIGRELLATPSDLPPVHVHDRTPEGATNGIPTVPIVRRLIAPGAPNFAPSVTHA